MIFIVDSGATKADWTGIDDKGNELLSTQTLGLSPEVVSRDIINERIVNNSDLNAVKDRVTKIHFYGAGCGTERMKKFMNDVMSHLFENAEIDILEDTYAAVYATIEHKKPSIICILGTGSNCSYWNGNQVIQKVSSLGYSIMDDCSGNYFGRQIIRDYYFNKIPKYLSLQLSNEYNLDVDEIKNQLYKQPNPNKYLASFARFLIENKNESYCKSCIRQGFEIFIENYIKQYADEYKKVKVHFVGSIAYYLQDQLTSILNEHQIKLGKVIKKPIEELLKYYRSEHKL